MQKIGLIDCNNFFVSCERLFRPDLEHKPVLVLSANDGCVVARSQEVKDMGIPMGIPHFKIKDIIKDNEIQVFSGNLTLYRDVSRRVFSMVRELFDVTEQYSIDEAFFQISDSNLSEKELLKVRRLIRKYTGIPVSIGVADTKTLAKLAAAKAKKGNGVQILDLNDWKKEATTMPLGDVWGVGYRLLQRYKKAGLHTAEGLMSADANRISRLFGVQGARLQAELKGIAIHQVSSQRPLQKSLMSSRSFNKKTNTKDVLQDALAYHIRHVTADLRSMDGVAQVLRVSLGTSRHGDFLLQGGSKEVALTQPSADTFSLLKEAVNLLDQLHTPGVPYKKIGVTLSGITQKQSQTASLFSENDEQKESLLQAIDGINKKLDREAVLIGSRLQSERWLPNAAARSGAYTTRWSDIPSVSAS